MTISVTVKTRRLPALVQLTTPGSSESSGDFRLDPDTTRDFHINHGITLSVRQQEEDHSADVPSSDEIKDDAEDNREA